MSTGPRTLEWLRTTLLQRDAQWVEETPHGFRWWPHQQAQTLETSDLAGLMRKAQRE